MGKGVRKHGFETRVERVLIPAVIFKGENYRIFGCDKRSLLDGLNNIL